MTNNKLRPIGTEFELTFPPAIESTNSESYTYRYRVVAHVLATTLSGGGEETLEELQVIARVEQDQDEGMPIDVLFIDGAQLQVIARVEQGQEEVWL